MTSVADREQDNTKKIPPRNRTHDEELAYVRIPNELISDPHLTPADKVVATALLQIVRYEGFSTKGWAFNQTIAEIACVDEKTVKRAIRKLEQRGWIATKDFPREAHLSQRGITLLWTLKHQKKGGKNTPQGENNMSPTRGTNSPHELHGTRSTSQELVSVRVSAGAASLTDSAPNDFFAPKKTRGAGQKPRSQRKRTDAEMDAAIRYEAKQQQGISINGMVANGLVQSIGEESARYLGIEP